MRGISQFFDFSFGMSFSSIRTLWRGGYTTTKNVLCVCVSVCTMTSRRKRTRSKTLQLQARCVDVQA